MYIENTVLYEPKHFIHINNDKNPFFYFFDYDVRSYAINMEFQHFHQFYEFCILLSPSAGHLIEGTRYDLKCFDIVAIRPSLLHRTHYPAGDPSRRIIIQFSFPTEIAGLEDSFQTLFSIFNAKVPIYRFEGEEKKAVFGKLNNIFKLSKSPNKLSTLNIHTEFIEFLSLIYLYKDSSSYTSDAPSNNIESKVYAITSYIHTHYTDPLSLEFISQKFFISSYYLSHQFKEITGFTLTDYIQMTRIRNVQSLLLTTNTPITEIAMQCGFASFSQFNRVFKKYVDIPPSEFRKKNGRT